MTLPIIWLSGPPRRSEIRKVPSAGMKVRMTPETMPGSARGTDREQRPPLAGAEVEARLEVGAVEPLQRRVERQHHEGQVDVDQADHHGGVVVEHKRLEGAGSGRGRSAEPAAPVPQAIRAEIHEALGAQHGDQGIGADQQVGPERKDDQQQEDRLHPRRREADASATGKPTTRQRAVATPAIQTL